MRDSRAEAQRWLRQAENGGVPFEAVAERRAREAVGVARAFVEGARRRAGERP